MTATASTTAISADAAITVGTDGSITGAPAATFDGLMGVLNNNVAYTGTPGLIQKLGLAAVGFVAGRKTNVLSGALPHALAPM